ncbi:MAG TPA: NosD domain-containing protein [Armatimonadota bacterium]
MRLLRCFAVERSLAAFCLILAGMGGHAATWYVNPAAPGPIRDGKTWATAFAAVQPAVDAAAATDEVWVARGVYSGHVSVPVSLSLYGGFAGNETSLASRHIAANPTILDAGGAVALVEGTLTGMTLAVDGFTLRHTNRDTGIAVGGYGTALNVSHCVLTQNGTGIGGSFSNVNALNCLFTGNAVGVSVNLTTAVVANSVIAGNGTGVLAVGTARVINNTIIGNGIGIDTGAATPVVTNNILGWNAMGYRNQGSTGSPTYCCFYQNGTDYSVGDPTTITSNFRGDPQLVSAGVGEVHLLAGSPCRNVGSASAVVSGWTDMDGEPRLTAGKADIGADQYSDVDHTPIARDLYVSPSGDDMADGLKGTSPLRTLSSALDAAWGHGGTIIVASGAYQGTTCVFNGVTVAGRYPYASVAPPPPTMDGGLSVISGAAPATLYGLVLRNGQAGVDVVCGAPVLANCVVMGNVDGIAVDGGTPTIVNCTIVGNRRGVAVYDGSPAITNTIVASNGTGIYQDAAATGPATLSHCCISSNETGFEGLDSTIGASGNIGTDPMFADAPNGDLHILTGSPCVNAGDTAAAPSGEDIDTQSRVLDGQVDIGADEANAANSRWPASVMHVNASTGDDANDGLTWATAKKTMQAAIDASPFPGGEVWVAAGRYTENVKPAAFLALYGGFKGDETQRASRAVDVNVTAIAATGDAVAYSGGHTFGTLDGFSVTGSDYGVNCQSSSPTIAHCVLTGSGIAVFSFDGSPNVQHNLAAGNESGFQFQFGRPTVRDNVIRASALGAVACWDAQLDFRENAVLGSTSAGVYVSDCTAALVNNTILANETGILNSASTVTAANNIVSGNLTGASATAGGTFTFQSNCFNDNRAVTSGVTSPVGSGGNIQGDPSLASAAYGDYHIQPASVCRGAGAASALEAGQADIDGDARPSSGSVDIGADQSDGTTRTAQPAIVRVSADGSDAGDGGSWGHAKATLQAAVDAVAETGGEVWVAAGTYTGSVAVRPFTHVFGGFTGVENTRAQRGSSSGLATLDGAGAMYIAKTHGGWKYETLDGFTMRNANVGVTSMSGAASITNNTLIGLARNGIVDSYGAPLIEDNLITMTGTPSVAGTAISLTSSSATLARNNIVKNSYWIGGTSTSAPNGGISADGGDALVIGNLIAGNSTGILSTSSSISILNNTISGNKVGVYYSGTEPVIANNVIANSSTYGIGRPTSSAAVTMHHNDVFGGGLYSGLPVQTGVRGNISADPLFRSAAGGNYRLSAGSPCIDAGDDAVPSLTVDLDGRDRKLGAAIDMGAYEFMASVYTIADAGAALKIAGGLTAGSADAIAKLDADASGHLEVVDVARILRNALGVD